MAGPTFGFVKLLASSGSHCTKWADEQHRPAGFESRLVPDLPLPFIPTLIGLRAFDHVSSRVWWEAATNKQRRSANGHNIESGWGWGFESIDICHRLFSPFLPLVQQASWFHFLFVHSSLFLLLYLFIFWKKEKKKEQQPKNKQTKIHPPKKTTTSPLPQVNCKLLWRQLFWNVSVVWAKIWRSSTYDLFGFGWVLWHINCCGLFNVKFFLYIYIKYDL